MAHPTPTPLNAFVGFNLTSWAKKLVYDRSWINPGKITDFQDFSPLEFSVSFFLSAVCRFCDA